MANKHTISDLYQMQSLPLSAKIRMTEYRIRQWYEEHGGEVYVSFSGGKDSTVLLHIARKLYPNIEAVFVNTGLEYPSVRRFALSLENVTELRPKMNFRDVIIKYGYPVISKEVSGKVSEARSAGLSEKSYAMQRFDSSSHYNLKYGKRFDISPYKYLLYAPFLISKSCCDFTKKKPAKQFERESGKKPIIGSMAEESAARRTNWLIFGCNAFEMKRPQSNPMSFWTENDVLEYIYENKLQIAEAYGNVFIKNKGDIDGQISMADFFNEYQDCKFCTTGCKRTGCVFCLFGIKQDKERIAKLQIKEPKLADYVLRGGKFGDNGYWQPNKDGLGYWFVIEWLNIHGVGIAYYKDIDYSGIYGNEKTREILIKEKIKAGMRKGGVNDCMS